MPPFPIVDSHLHIWQPDLLSYGWIAGDTTLNRSFSLADYDAAKGPVDVAAMVFVECDVDPPHALAEAAWVTSVAEGDRRIRAMVAHAPLEHGDAVRAHLDRLADFELTKGVRRLLQQEADPEFCLRPAFLEGMKALGDYGWSFDICVTWRQMEGAIELVRRFPDTQFIFDHIGKPNIREGQIEPWASQMKELARSENVICKLSGVATEADHQSWTLPDIAPYMRTALEAFGTGRLMYGSDWPVATKAIGYPEWIDAIDAVLGKLSANEQRAFYRDNACRAYRFEL